MAQNSDTTATTAKTFTAGGQLSLNWGSTGLATTPLPTPNPTSLVNTFSFTGSSQTFTVPSTATYITVEAYGAQGNGNYRSSQYGGKGGKIVTTINVGFGITAGQTLFLYVGGQNSYNGGGGGTGGGYPGGNGGGASDVRTVSGDTTSRIVVAGGGGGTSSDCNGADGGGLTGASSGCCYNGCHGGGQGGSQSAGGSLNGAIFQGGGGGGTGGSEQGGGGGGGYYGGGGGIGNYGGGKIYLTCTLGIFSHIAQDDA